MFSYSPNFYQERLQRLVVRCISICRAVIRHLQGSKLTRDMMVMKAVTAWCCRVRSAAPEIHFPLNKEVQFSIHFCSILCIKYFLICKIKRYVIMFFVYKNRFLARQIGPVMAFISDNISVHVHLLENNDPIKKNKDGCCQLGFSVSLIFHKTTRVFQRRSLLVYLCRYCRQRKVKTVSSCGAHFRSGDNIFSVQIATTTVCITRKMHLYRHLSRFLGRSLDFSSV